MNIKKVLVSTLGTAAVLGAGFFASTTSANADVRVSVKSGDTVSKIANQYNSSVSAIEKANDLKNVNLIYVGESLVVPSASSTDTTSSQAATSSQSTTVNDAYNNTNTTDSANYSGTNTYNNTTNYSNQSASTGTTSTRSTTSTSGDSSSAKAWIANKESGGSYSARNGQYIGKYQLTDSYLNGDYSAANQEKVADSYVASRYGSWSAAKSFWQANGWY